MVKETPRLASTTPVRPSTYCTSRRRYYLRCKNLTLSPPCKNYFKQILSKQALAKAHSSSVFDFVPGRWLGPNTAKPDWFLVTFSGGPQSCQGIKCIVFFLCLPEASQSHCFDSLAYCESYLGLAHLFRRRFELRIDESRCDLSHDLRSLADLCPCKTAQSRSEGTFLSYYTCEHLHAFYSPQYS